MPSDDVFRTFSLPASLRKAVNDKREELGLTMRDFVRQAVDAELGKLVQVLGRELPKLRGPQAKPARLPLSDSILAKLHKAAAAVDIPLQRLFLICLFKASRQ